MKLCPKMHTICYESLRDILHALDIKLIHTIITFHLMKLSSLCRDLNENVKYRLIKVSRKDYQCFSYSAIITMCLVQH